MNNNQLTGASLSTMWAVQDRFINNMNFFVEVAKDIGFDGIEINHSMTEKHIQQIRKSALLPIHGVHGPAPLKIHAGRGENRGLNLASLDPEERTIIINDHIESIELAADTGANHVVVHLGHVGDGMLAEEKQLRKSFSTDKFAEEDMISDLVVNAHSARQEIAGHFLESAKNSLDQLANVASKRGVKIGIENRLHFHEIPLPSEYEELLEPYTTELVGYLHDVGHAEVLARLRLVKLDSWWGDSGSYGPGRDLIAMHIHDTTGIRDHVAPGEGTTNFIKLQKQIARSNPNAALTFEIDQRQTDLAVGRGLTLLQQIGIVL